MATLQSRLSSLATRIATEVKAKALAVRTITAGSGLTGGGDLTADRTLAIDFASQAQAEAGTDTTHGMNALRTKQAIVALGGGGGADGYVPQASPAWTEGGAVNVRYYAPAGFQFTTTAAAVGSAAKNKLYRWVGNVVATGLAFEVSTLVAATTARIGIYDSDANGWPNALLYDSGDISTATTGIKTFSFGADVHLNGVYWIVITFSGNVSCRTMTATGPTNDEPFEAFNKTASYRQYYNLAAGYMSPLPSAIDFTAAASVAGTSATAVGVVGKLTKSF